MAKKSWKKWHACEAVHSDHSLRLFTNSQKYKIGIVIVIYAHINASVNVNPPPRPEE